MTTIISEKFKCQEMIVVTYYIFTA